MKRITWTLITACLVFGLVLYSNGPVPTVSLNDLIVPAFIAAGAGIVTWRWTR